MQQLLQLLADGCFHSGETLAASLGISRSAVWKRLQVLQQTLGLELFAVRGKGYKLARPLQLLDAVQLCGQLEQTLLAEVIPDIEVHLSLDSTNRHALELAKQRPQQRRLVIAERQSAGRGRRGRRWVSPFGRNLYLSLYWWFDAIPPTVTSLSLAIGVVLAKCLEAAGIPHCELKWPNDVHYQGQKLAGILLEMQVEAGGGCGVVIGIGVNLDMPTTAAEGIGQAWTDVRRITDKEIDRHEFTCQLVSDLLNVLQQYSHSALPDWHAEWQQRDVLQGQQVNVALNNETFEGISRGVDAQGALLLEQHGQVRRLFSGDVSVRLAEHNR